MNYSKMSHSARNGKKKFGGRRRSHLQFRIFNTNDSHHAKGEK